MNSIAGRALAAAAVLLSLLPSCDRSDKGTNSAKPEVATVQASTGAQRQDPSPAETVRQVHKLRAAGQLELLEAYLLPDQRPHIVGLIHAMDQLLSANQVLQASVTRHLGPATAAAFDRSDAANAIGVFSREVQILNERVEGDKAFVTIQVAGRVPLEEVELVRRPGRWKVRTDPPIPEVSEELRKLAEVLVQAARRLEAKGLTAAELKRELDSQQAPIGRRLAELTEGSP
jgi:hypothetical protein